MGIKLHFDEFETKIIEKEKKEKKSRLGNF